MNISSTTKQSIECVKTENASKKNFDKMELIDFSNATPCFSKDTTRDKFILNCAP